MVAFTVDCIAYVAVFNYDRLCVLSSHEMVCTDYVLVLVLYLSASTRTLACIDYIDYGIFLDLSYVLVS